MASNTSIMFMLRNIHFWKSVANYLNIDQIYYESVIRGLDVEKPVESLRDILKDILFAKVELTVALNDTDSVKKEVEICSEAWMNLKRRNSPTSLWTRAQVAYLTMRLRRNAGWADPTSTVLHKLASTIENWYHESLEIAANEMISDMALLRVTDENEKMVRHILSEPELAHPTCESPQIEVPPTKLETLGPHWYLPARGCLEPAYGAHGWVNVIVPNGIQFKISVTTKIKDNEPNSITIGSGTSTSSIGIRVVIQRLLQLWPWRPGEPQSPGKILRDFNLSEIVMPCNTVVCRSRIQIIRHRTKGTSVKLQFCSFLTVLGRGFHELAENISVEGITYKTWRNNPEPNDITNSHARGSGSMRTRASFHPAGKTTVRLCMNSPNCHISKCRQRRSSFEQREECGSRSGSSIRKGRV